MRSFVESFTTSVGLQARGAATHPRMKNLPSRPLRLSRGRSTWKTPLEAMVSMAACLGLANLPARIGNRVIRRPSDASRICSTRRSAGARVAAATHRQEVIASLGRECLNRQGEIPCHAYGALLVVAI